MLNPLSPLCSKCNQNELQSPSSVLAGTCFECSQSQRDYKSCADTVTPVKPPENKENVPNSEERQRAMNVAPTGGLRDNKGKAPLSLVPLSLIKGVAEVIWKSSTAGGGKYPMHNWRKGLFFLDTAACALRHIFAWLEGEDCDKETGLHHLKHAACNIAFLLEYIEKHPELDNRHCAPVIEVKR